MGSVPRPAADRPRFPVYGSADKTIGLQIPGWGKLTLLDPLSETVTDLPSACVGSDTHVNLTLPGYACCVICQE